MNLKYYILFIGGLLTLFLNSSLYAQNTLFQEVNPLEVELNDHENQAFKSSNGRSTWQRRQLLLIQPEQLQIDSNDVQIFSDPASQAHWTSTNYRGEGNYTWFGTMEDGTGVFLTVMNGKIASKFYLGNTPCLLSPVGDRGYHVLTRFDGQIAHSMACGNTTAGHNDHFHEPVPQPKIKQPPVERVDGNATNLRMLVVVTNNAETEMEATGMTVQQFVQMAIDESNLAYQQSGTNNFQMELARIIRTNYNEENTFQSNGRATDLQRFRDNSGTFGSLESLRNRYDTDVQVLIREANFTFVRDGSTRILFGQAYEVPTTSAPSARNAYCFVSIDGITSGRFSFVHEVGHLQGCRHDNDDRTPDFARGYRFNTSASSTRTIMAVGCGSCRIQFFSNPNVDFGTTPVGTNTRNNARRIRETASDVLNHRETATNLALSGEDVGEDLGGNFLAKNQISNSGTFILRDGSVSTMRASQRVLLTPGFRTLPGATFRAYTRSNAANPLPVLAQSADVPSSNLQVLEQSEEEETISSSQVYPNPSREQAVLRVNTPVEDDILFIEIYDQVGTRHYQSQVTLKKGAQDIDLPVKDLTPGVYFCRIYLQGEMLVKRFVVL